MAPLEPWKRVYINDDFMDSIHGNIDCIWCHEGNEKSNDKTTAHDGLVSAPSEDSAYYCGVCHGDEDGAHVNSLHRTQEGYFERFSLRAGYDLRDAGQEHKLEEFQAECGQCHATCGQCHVTRPVAVGTGLNWAHEFNKTPDLQTNCTACHGSRIGEEYKGEHEGLKADVHYIPGAKRCEFCHSGQEMHGGDGTYLTYRYDEQNSSAPKCETCHSSIKESNDYHRQHWSGDAGVTLSCQVCHSQAYKNCNGCHVGGSGITGSSYLSFEIGRNYLETNVRYQDYDYITVRHIPIAPNTFEPWGEDDLKYFESSEPTWKLTFPHNIQRWTPQTEVAEGQTCGKSCHDSSYYLRLDDIENYENANFNEETGESGYGYDEIERERTANKDVIIPY
ncbi:MAG: hypothetical protein GY868_13460 [Deltaproteobacteria bacterium]|nr:hypothetical protein [Deltaproteobacteria bacterium]